MRGKRNLFVMLGVFIVAYSCKDNIQIDSPSILSYQTAEVAYMGDSIPVVVTVDGSYPLSSVKVSFFQDGDLISEKLIPASKSGTYEGKLLVPFIKDVAGGEAEIHLMVKNRNFNYATTVIPIQVSRPEFPYLTLKTAYGDYRMEPVPDKPYTYAATENFPSTQLNALVEAPAYGENGNAFYFGGGVIKANASDQDSIAFQTDLVEPGMAYTVSFDVRSYQAAPFLVPSFAGTPFPDYTGNIAVIEQSFANSQSIQIRGILDIADWWIDPTFLDRQGDGTLTFRAMDGKYRVTADRGLKYFRIEPMDGDQLADFDPATKTGGIWVNGGVGNLEGSAPVERLGIPSMTSNPSLWNPEKNVAMAPLGDGIYQLRLKTNETMFQSNVSGSNVGISFYQNSRSFDNALGLDLVQTLYGGGMSTSPDGGTPRFELQQANGQSNGQMIASGSNRNLGERTFVFTLDVNVSPAAVSISVAE
ncbi:DUF5125 domain-containing protein [Parapedobacter sp. 2B3]|uniref:DUF5125 domain-containing protein n=1 Tax=Parapedobacter sp. 2B3 TaxID=3342381 RepID=UPI0035B5AFBE